MKTLLSFAVVLCCACGQGSKTTNPNQNQNPLSCNDGQTLTYAPRFGPAAGASGVATAEDAAAGYVSSDNKQTGPTVALDGGAEDVTAMVTSCGQTQCEAGQVAISIPPPAAGGGFGTAAGGDFAGDPPTPGPAPEPQPQPEPTTKCAPPPPSCAEGLSPQYSFGKGTWECTDCSLVVTYGGIYGNYRRCVSAPTITCTQGQVPTYSYEGEIWECKPTCDNGMYDQHTISGQLVCVPC